MKRFLIVSLALAGFVPEKEAAANPLITNDSAVDTIKFKDLLDRALPFTLIGHSSHRSHGSHRSHRSHRSSQGRSGPSIPPTPAPPPVQPPSGRNKNSTPPKSILPDSPAIDLPKLKGNPALTQRVVKRIQMLLFSMGHYVGGLDGIAGENTKAAVAKYQAMHGLKVTGTIDDTLIKSLGISID